MRSFFKRSDSGGVSHTDGALEPPMSPSPRGPRSAFDIGRAPPTPQRGVGYSPGTMFSPSKRPRPRLDNAFKDELKQSVHQIMVQKQKKRNRFNFFGNFRQRSSSDVGSEPSTKNPLRKLTTKQSPVPDRNDDGRPADPARLSSNNRQQGLTRGRPTLRKDVAEELKMSFTNRNEQKQKRQQLASQIKTRRGEEDQAMENFSEEESWYSSDSDSNSAPRKTSIQQSQSAALRPKVAQPTSKDKRSPPAPGLFRPKLRADVADELRQSVHNRNAKKAERRAQVGRRGPDKRPVREEVDSTDDSVGANYQQPLKDARQDSRDQGSRDMKPVRRQMDRNLANELRQSVHSRNEKNNRRIISRDLANELRASVHSRNDKKDQRRKEIAKRIMKRRESERQVGGMKSSFSKGSSHHSVSFDFSTHSMGSSKSFEDDADSLNDRHDGKKKSPSPRHLKTKSAIKDSLHSTGTFTAEFSDDPRVETKKQPDRQNRWSPPSEIHTTPQDYADIEGDFDEYKREWSRLIKEKKKLKESVTTYKLEITDLASKLEIYKSEKDRLQDQLFDAHEKVERLSAQQTEERKQFDSSTDIIAVTRMDLAKALNDARILKAKISEYELALAQKDRRVDSLNDAIDTQEERIDEFLAKIKATENEVRQQTEEKLLLEEELGVLEDLKDRKKFNDTLQKIKRERSKWIEQQERELEMKRQALIEDSNKAREKERVKLRRETEETRNLNKKIRAREEELEEMQEEIDRQLKGFREENRVLKEKLNRERLDSAVELKKKEHTVALLQQEISKLKKEAARHHSENMMTERLKAAAETAEDELKDALQHKKILEKEMKRTKREVEKLKSVANDWQEVVLPGHRNLRGVTFGNANSDSLAGFLTILVEEQYKARRKRSKGKSNKLKKFLKDGGKKRKRKREKRKKKEKKKKSKKKSTKEKIDGHSISRKSGHSLSRKSTVTDDSDFTIKSDTVSKKSKKKKGRDKGTKKHKKKDSKDKKRYKSSDSKRKKDKKDKKSKKEKVSKSDKKKKSKKKRKEKNKYSPPATIRVKKKKHSKE